MTHLKSMPDQSAALIGETPATREPRPPRKPSRPRGKTPPPVFVALADETRHTVDTACAAWHLGRKPQTLRYWACHECGPIRPVTVYGRLHWPVASLRSELGAA